MAGHENPIFNGLSEAGFHSGTEIISSWQKLDPRVRTEVYPHAVQHLTYELLGDGATPEELRALAASAQEAADQLRHSADIREAAARPHELRPEDY